MSLRARISTPEEHGSRGEDGHLVAAYRAKLLEEIDLAEMGSLAAADRRSRLERVLGHIISREGPVLSTVERSQLIRRVVDEALGLGILEPCWRTPRSPRSWSTAPTPSSWSGPAGWSSCRCGSSPPTS